jgi:hypothetical protein
VTDLLELPLVEPVIADVDDNLDHIVCCDDDITLCGLYLPGDEFCEINVDAPDVCEVCANKERLGQPCTVADCRKRSS